MSGLHITQQVVQVGMDIDPMLRVSQVQVDVGVVNASKLRQTHEFVQVLYQVSGSIDKSLTSDLTFTQDVVIQAIFNRSVESTLTFTHDAITYNNQRIGNTLAFSHSVQVRKVLNVLVGSILQFTQAVDYDNDQTFYASNTLEFTQTVLVKRVLPVKTASNTLTFSQEVFVSRPVSNQLTFTQTVAWAWGGQELTASSNLAFTHDATAQLISNQTTANTLTFTQTATANIIRVGGTDVTQVFSITQHVVGVVVKADNTYVLLQAPYPKVEASIVLPAPELDDKENNVSDMFVKRAMDGTRRVYVKRSPSRRLAYTFDLTRQKGLELEAFLNTYNHEHFIMQNWKGEIWDVQLLTNPLDFVQNRRHGPDGANVGINLEFEGVKLSG